jgi:cellulose synthase (UDP-forming)
VTRLPATLYLDNGQVLRAQCVDFSMTGVGLTVGEGITLAVGERLQVGLWMGDVEHTFAAKVMLSKGRGMIGLEFEDLNRDEQMALVQCTFARTDAWVDWGDQHAPDKPLQGLGEITHLGLLTYKRLWTGFWELAVHWHRSRWKDA